MAIEVEDGTGKANADAYVSVADADAYFLKRNVTAWSAMDDAAKEAALIRSADFITEQYETRFVGVRLVPTQALSWPRDLVPDPYDPTGLVLDPATIPQAVTRASLELALIFRNNDPYDPKGTEVAGGALVSERKKIGPIETEKRYSTSSTTTVMQTAIPSPEEDRITAMLRPFLLEIEIGQLYTRRA